MTVSFTSYGFKADVSQANQVERTLPERLNDIINVKDFGAVGDGITDDTSAIDSAIDYAWVLGHAGGGLGATIFFPPGTYIITGPFHLDRDPAVMGTGSLLKYVGSGKDVSILKGSYNTVGISQIWDLPNSFLVTCGEYESASVVGIFDLTIENDSTAEASGALNVVYSGNEFQLIRCHLVGTVGYVNCGNTFSATVRDCTFTNIKAITAANAATRSPLFDRANFVTGVSLVGSVGMYVADNILINNRISGFDIGIAFSQSHETILGNYISRCGIGIAHGLYGGSPIKIHEPGVRDPGGWSFANANTICGNVIDRCTWGQYSQSSSCLSAANVITGARNGDQSIASPWDAVVIQSMNWNVVTHEVTVTTSTHNISGTPNLQLAIVISGGSNLWTSDPTGFVVVTGTPTGDSFTYAGPSSAPSTFSSGTWNYAAEHSILVQAIQTSLIAATVVDDNEALDNIGFSSPVSNLSVALYSEIWNMRGQRPWTPAGHVGGVTFEMCGTTTNNPSQFVTFADLPGQVDPNQVELPKEGMEFNIIDAQAQPAWAGTVTGGSSTNHYKIRYDGTNWIRVA